MSPNIIITGKREVGKSTLLYNIYEYCKKSNIPVAGVLTLGQENRRLLYVETGEYLPFEGSPDSESLLIGKFRISLSAFEKGGSVIQNAPPDSILLVDEIGQFELEKKGWFPALKETLQVKRPFMLISVRIEGVEAFLRYFSFLSWKTLLLTPENRDKCQKNLENEINEKFFSTTLDISKMEEE